MADRRSLLDGDEAERRSIREGMNVFDDEFEVEDFDVVADGFRGRGSAETARQDHDRHRISSVAAHYAPQPVTTGSARSSTRKSRGGAANPFASPEDEGEVPLRRTASGNFMAGEVARRSTSSASSSNVYARTGSPRIVAGGPSHPYGMYPQGTVARTPSIASQSTIRPQRNSSVRGGPTHPYTMYPQGIGDDFEDEEDSTPQQLVPVGFPGLGQSYQRRVGPEGEDQDLIGDFGHTEQLPPYTRYPEDGPEKPLLGVPDPPTALHSRAPVQGTDPGNPLMHAHIQPEQRQSMSDESTIRRQASTASRRTMLPILENASSSGSLAENKSWNEKSWQERRRTRVCCGISVIWLAIGLAVLLFVGALVGGVLGGYVVGKSTGKDSVEDVQATSMYDASLISTPTAVPLPTGTFALQYGDPEGQEDACLLASQASAWTCEFAGNPDTMINIGTSPMENHDMTGAFLYSGITPTSQLLYGLQVSSMQTQFEPFLLVSDRDDPENGHAYYFQTTYDKVVVLPGNELPGGSTSSNKDKRGVAEKAEALGVAGDVANIGDKPWFCYWNETSLEGFIYVDKPMYSTTTPPQTSATPRSTANYTAAAEVYETSESRTGWVPAYATTPPTSTISTEINLETATVTYTGEASSLPSWLNENYPNYQAPPWLNPTYDGDGDADDYDYDDDDDDGKYPPTRRLKRDHASTDWSWSVGQSVPVFPYLVKIEERRRPESPQPYCQQYQLLNDGSWNWIPDPTDDSKPIEIQLDEHPPDYKVFTPGQQMKEKRSWQGACHCQWLSGMDV